MEKIELNQLWEQIKDELFLALPESVHPWIFPLQVSALDKDVITLVTPQIMGRDILRKNYSPIIKDVISKVTNSEVNNFIIIYDEKETNTIKKENQKIQKKIAEVSLKEQAMMNLSNMQSSANLNLKYKFENFVVGENNRFAHAIAMTVAENPAKKYNPLFMYGNAGLGKTHLMQAIGHYTIFNNPKLKVKYIKTGDYITDFISNSRFSKDQVENMSKFNKKYTNIDIILIDDIQFIEGKGKTMAQMQHTFDNLYNKGKQIVISSDRHPKELSLLTQALCSRFEMGLMVELTPPDFETRFNILKKLAFENGLDFSEDALKYIARNFTTNVRELEGAFHKVCAYAEFNKLPLSLELAKNILKCDEVEPEISFDSILNTISELYHIDSKEIKGSARGQKISQARHLAIYLSRELTQKSFANIAEYFNKKHTTIMFAHDKIKKELETNNELVSTIREIKLALKLM